MSQRLQPHSQAMSHNAAITWGDMKGVIALVQKEPKIVNEAVLARKGEKAGFTPIILAAALANADMVKYLMSENADITILDDYNRSVFWYSALNGDFEVTKVVLSIAKPPVVTSVINTPDLDLMQPLSNSLCGAMSLSSYVC